MRLKIYFFNVLLLLSISVPAYSETVYLTSTEWPPYSGVDLPQQGASVAVARAAFAAMGHELKVDFMAWSRAIKISVQADSKYLGYFPAYANNSKKVTFSDVMGHSPLGIIENKANPVAWETASDFSKYKLGVVQDYTNTKELDALIADGTIKPSVAPSDLINIQKLSAGRIDAAVIDINVFNSFLKSSAKLESSQDKLQANSKLLINKELTVGIKVAGDGAKWLEVYNQGLKKIDVDAIEAALL
jgi:polar amino acid transport system substrate-binding protein